MAYGLTPGTIAASKKRKSGVAEGGAKKVKKPAGEVPSAPAQAVTDPRAYGQGKTPKPVVRAAGMGRSLHGDPAKVAAARGGGKMMAAKAAKWLTPSMRTQPMPPEMGMTKGPGMKMQPAARKTAGFGKRKR